MSSQVGRHLRQGVHKRIPRCRQHFFKFFASYLFNHWTRLPAGATRTCSDIFAAIRRLQRNGTLDTLFIEVNVGRQTLMDSTKSGGQLLQEDWEISFYIHWPNVLTKAGDHKFTCSPYGSTCIHQDGTNIVFVRIVGPDREVRHGIEM